MYLRPKGNPLTNHTPSSVQRKPRRWPWIAGMVGTCVLGFIIGAASKPVDEPTVVTAGPSAGAQLDVPTTEAAPPAPTGPATTASAGVHQVGVDIAPGQYKTPGGGLCYWARSKDDSGNFDSIIANDNLQGPGSVTVNAGEFLKLSGSCVWTKTG